MEVFGLIFFMGMVWAILKVFQPRRHRRLPPVFRPAVRVKRLKPVYRPVERPPRPTPQAAPTLKLLKGRAWVVDGDTIIIDKCSIRLAGIDAPELDHPYGINAKSALIKLCKGQIVRAEIIDGETTHDRFVAHCYLPDGRDLAAEMVKLGLAIDWKKFSGGKYRHLETPDVRRKLWRCDARQIGRMPPHPLQARTSSEPLLIEPD